MSKRIHVGLDVHQSTTAIGILRGDESTPEVLEVPSDGKALARVLKRLQREGEVRCCYEAGPCGFAPYRDIKRLGIACDVIAPALIPVLPGRRIKTDRRDAAKLVRLFRAGELTAVHVPDEEYEALRDLVRAREDVRKDLVAARHRLTKFLLRRGLSFSEGKNWTEKYWAWLGRQKFEREGERLTFEHYMAQVEHLEVRRAALDKSLLELAKADAFRDQVQRLSCMRGFTELGAIVVIAELNDLRRFPTPRKLMAYLGLVPSEHSSGGKHSRGGITKAGNSHARRAFVEAAWAYRHHPRIGDRMRKALTRQPAAVTNEVHRAQLRLHKRFNRLISRGKRSQVAVTAVARELTGFVWALMVKNAA